MTKLHPPLLSADDSAPRPRSEAQSTQFGREAGLERYADLYDSAPVAYFSLDCVGTILQLNLAAARLLGRARPELIGRRFGAFVHEECIAEFDDLLAKTFAEPVKVSGELRLLTQGEPAAFMVAHLEACADDQGLECRLAVLDITLHIMLEERLREAEQFASSLIDSFTSHVCVLDTSGRIVAVNQAWKAFHEANFPGEDGAPGPSNYFLGANYLATCDLACGPDSEEAKAMAAGIRAVCAGDLDSFTLDYPCHSPGQQRWFCARVTRFHSGKRYVVVAHENITEHRQAMGELRLAALVYQVMNEAIIMADADNRIVAVNPAFTRLTGYTAEEAIGQTTSLLKSGRQSAEFYQRMWQSLNTTGHWQGEIWNRRKNGEIYIEWLSISTMYGEDGKVLRRVAMFSDLTEQKRNESIIWRQANYDVLTGLPNRSLFQDRLLQEAKSSRREGHSVALMLIDLDYFKEVNDTFGHAIGDQLLVETSRRISACIREADTLARLGGDEFTVILPGLTDASRIERVAQDIIDAVVKPYQLGHEIAHVSASIGITLYPADATDPEALMKNADQAMYAAKGQGRNRYSYFTAGMQRAALERHRLAQDLRGALAAGQLVVYYQPIIHLASGRVAKVEALLRWRHPVDGLVESSAFIQLAEEIGLINAIGDWVFNQAVSLVEQWKAAHDDSIQVCINKSPRQFMECVHKENWIAHLHEAGLSSSCVAIEVPESLLLDSRPEIASMLAQFSAAGLQITVDDFGAGLTAMSCFKKYHIDYLKIDRCLVGNMEADPADQAIVEALISMAHRLGLKVIAEGVETARQREWLAAVGCDYAQGYGLARPMPAEDLNAWLRLNRAPSA